MPSKIEVHFLPDHFDPDNVAGGTAVIVDILRASTTILTALHNGAARVLPCLTVDDARQRHREDNEVLLGGERNCERIEGFQFSNSSRDYTPAAVRDRTIAFTTTNGTRALLMSRQADEVLIGAFANLSCLADRLAPDRRALHIVCAGTNGQITGEDVLFAGCLTERLTTNAVCEVSDTAAIATGYWQSATCTSGLNDALRTCLGGRNLVKLGYDADIEFAATQDTAPVIARFEGGSGAIVRAM